MKSFLFFINFLHNFFFIDAQSYVDLRHIFLELTYVCVNEDDSAIKQTDFITTTNPNSHTIIDSVDVNIGECQISKSDKGYPLMAKMGYLQRYTKKARKTFLAEFEGYDEDVKEPLTENIQTCFTKETIPAQGGEPEKIVFHPITAQGRIAQRLWEDDGTAADQNFLVQLFSPLQSFNTLLPSNLDFSIRIQFTDNCRYFVTSTTGKKPKFKIKGYLKKRLTNKQIRKKPFTRLNRDYWDTLPYVFFQTRTFTFFAFC